MSHRSNARTKIFIPVVDTSAYSSGDVIGSVTELDLAVLDNGGCAKLVSLVVRDESNAKKALDLIFFSQAPANSVGVDQAAYALSDADVPRLIGRISIAAADYVSSSTNNAEATFKEKDLGLLLQAAAGSKSLFVLLVSRDTPTYGAADDLSFVLGLEQY